MKPFFRSMSLIAVVLIAGSAWAQDTKNSAGSVVAPSVSREVSTTVLDQVEKAARSAARSKTEAGAAINEAVEGRAADSMKQAVQPNSD